MGRCKMFLPILWFLYVTGVLAEGECPKSNEATESCFQVYQVPKSSVQCEPTQEVKDSIDLLQSSKTEILESITNITARLDVLDPSVPKQLPQNVTEQLNAVDTIKNSQAVQVEVLRRIESAINDTHRRLDNVESRERDEIRNLIEKQVLLTEMVLDKSNNTLQDRYLESLSTTTRDLTEKLRELEAELTEKIQNNNEAYEKILEDVGKMNEEISKVDLLQGELEQEKSSRTNETRRTAALELSMATVKDTIAELIQQRNNCCSEVAQLREEVLGMKSKMDRLLPRTLKIEDCQDALRFYSPNSGVYDISPDPTMRPTPVFCDFSKDDEGWTVIQRRQDGSEDFYRNWTMYKEGFGEESGEYWLGLKYIHALTAAKNYTLQVELEDWQGKWLWAEYQHFRVAGENHKYKLHVQGYSGNAGDSLKYHNGMYFSTWDNRNDLSKHENCTEVSHGAWWYKSCFNSNLNGRYYQTDIYDTVTNYGDGLVWQTARQPNTNLYSMKSSIMKIKPRPSYV